MSDMIANHPDYDHHKSVIYIHDRETGLRGFIALHNDVLGAIFNNHTAGKCLGGTRMYPYEDEHAALTDALRLSRGMTYKQALAGLPYGGAKGVLIGDPKKDKGEKYLRAYARRVESLCGAFITGEDVGITVSDVEVMAKECVFVCGRSEGLHNGVKGSGDPSPVTAIGVLYGIRACLEAVFGNDQIAGHSFAIQGLGKVGFRLCRLISEQGGKLIVSDVDSAMMERALQEFHGSRAVKPEEIHAQEVDVFSPCAMGAIINDRTIPEIKAKIVAGAANNQLARAEHGDILFGKGIVYAPDYVINAGGLINVADELEPGGYDRERALKKTARISETLKILFEASSAEKTATNRIADLRAEEILKAAENLKRKIRHTGS